MALEARQATFNFSSPQPDPEGSIEVTEIAQVQLGKEVHIVSKKGEYIAVAMVSASGVRIKHIKDGTERINARQWEDNGDTHDARMGNGIKVHFKKVSEKEGEVSITEGKAHIATKDLGIKLGESSEAVILSIVQRESGGKLRTFLVVENP